MQAIVSATSENARWLKDPMIGSIAAGKWADLLVLDKNPLSDIRNTETINSVYIAGNSIPTIWETCRDRPLSACQPRPADLPGMPY
jgi:imidazolonepropionase-like amidohydrolase